MSKIEVVSIGASVKLYLTCNKSDNPPFTITKKENLALNNHDKRAEK